MMKGVVFVMVGIILPWAVCQGRSIVVVGDSWAFQGAPALSSVVRWMSIVVDQ